MHRNQTKQPRLLPILTACLALSAAACHKNQAASNGPGGAAGGSATAAVGGPAPEFTLPGSQGDEVRLSQWRGQVVVIDFWASWCKPCREELPALEALYQAQKDKGLVVIGVNLDEERTDALAFLKQHNVSFPIGFDPEGTMADTWELPKMPTSYIIDTEGKIVHMHAGYETGDDQKIAAEISELLPK